MNKRAHKFIQGFIEVHREACDKRFCSENAESLHTVSSDTSHWKKPDWLRRKERSCLLPRWNVVPVRNWSKTQKSNDPTTGTEWTWPSTHSENEVLRQTGIKSWFRIMRLSHDCCKLHSHGNSKYHWVKHGEDTVNIYELIQEVYINAAIRYGCPNPQS